MPGNLPATDDIGYGVPVTATDNQGTSRGRKRYCKKCTFTCTDARAFTAHQATHSDSDDNRIGTSSASSHSSSFSDNIQSGRVLRPKRNSKGSVSDKDTFSFTMEPDKDPLLETHSTKVTKTVEYITQNVDVIPLSIDTDQTNSDVFKSSQKTGTHTVNFSREADEELMDADEGEDETDAMTATNIQSNINDSHMELSDVNRMSNDTANNFNSEKDIDEEDRLVIDDDSVTKTSTRLDSIQSRTYSCQHCPMITTSTKTYLYHVKESHNTDVTIYECDRCDYATVYKQKLARHRKVHFLPENDKILNPTFDSSDKTLTMKIEDKSHHSKFSFSNSSAHNLPFMIEKSDDMDDDDDEDDISSTDQKSALVPIKITPENIDQVLDEDKKKKKKTRQEVDPGKYFEAVDSSGTKYACSQCGNIYKWRKSLNKHWKEKHSVDPLVEVASPPGMHELLKSGKYTQLGARRIYDKTFLSTIKTNKCEDPSRMKSSPHSLTQTPSPPNFLNSTPIMARNAARMNSSATSLIPKMIGPFIASTAQPVFPGMPMALPHIPLHTNGYESPEEGALDLTRDSKSRSRESPYVGMSAQEHSITFDQVQPLDFSKTKQATEKVKIEKPWEDVNSLKPAHSINQLIPRLHQCSKCDFTSASEVEFANHTSSHLNKRIVRCFECKIQINSMDELNNHFIKNHFRKLTEYKEAIKKIPHGLQQTYHLLNMEIHDIGELGNQDLGASEGKSLKCKKCDFEAKWPAELQKHAVSHSEERPYICMVCGSTYKWKWDLVKHFQKSHPNLPNPYRRNDKKDTTDGSSEDDDEPISKRAKLEASNAIINGNFFSRDDNISVEGIIAATQAGQRLISSQPNLLDDEPNMDRNLSFFNEFPYASAGDINKLVHAAQAAQEIDRRNKAQKIINEAVRNRQNSSSGSSDSSSNKKNAGRDTTSSSPSPGGSKSEELPYKCTMCNYHARWPSEVTQHMKNHSDSKPYLCPRCEYRSKWKWDVVKHLKRCGGGGINDVIDTTKSRRKEFSVSNGPPNAIVSQQGKVKKMTPQPLLTYGLPSGNESGQQGNMPASSGQNHTSDASSGDDSRSGSNHSNQDHSNSSTNNNDSSATECNINNNYSSYTNGLPFENINLHAPAVTNTIPTMGIINSSNSPACSPAPSPIIHPSSSRHNAEVWNCPHCPFTTQSQAELKRHSGLHSDDKPFRCDVCQYSTRWACDLKKHRKSYNHFPKTNVVRDNKEKMNASLARFKCTQCNILFQTFQNLLDHRMAEHIGQDSSQSSPAPLTEIEIDAARIKHPRKQVKRVECNKCSFVCKNRQTMDKHMEEHEQLELSGIHCFYCSSLFKDKECLLDHITTHSAFNPKEWETFFMISDDDQHQQKEDGKIQIKKENKSQQSIADKTESSHSGGQLQKKYSENDKQGTESTEARIQQILNEVPKQMTACQQSSNVNKFKCEWCPAEFVNLTAVYKHASQAHPIQLKEQDVHMIVSGQTHLSKTSLAQKLPAKKHYNKEPIDILKQQITEKRNQHLTDKCEDMLTSKLTETPCNKVEDERGNKRYNCEKCTFSSANFATFQRHHELHGSKLTSQCWFCDYSVDRMNLLYQHMKISHTRKWKALSQDPKYATQIHRMNLAFANSSNQGNNNDSPPEISQMIDFSAMDLSSKSKTSHSEVTHDITYITKQQYTWSGIPVNIVPMGNALNFVCPHCAFHDASIAETCCHVMQSHRAMSKFTCKTCQFTDDNIHVMSDHCKTEHALHDKIVEVLDFKQINFSELQIVQLNALREQMAQDLSRKSETKTDSKFASVKSMSCPFCPFKTLVTEHMKKHVSDHSKQARYRCQMCDFSSEIASDITEHVKVHEIGYTMDHRSYIEKKLPVSVKKELTDRKMNEQDTQSTARLGENLESSELSHSDQEDSPRSKSGKRIRYRCSTCPYYTTCRSNMVKHVRQHNNNKRYKCTKCSYGAARAVLLKNHLDSHETPVEDDGQFYDIFCDPNSTDNALKCENNEDIESEETELDFDDDYDRDDDANSDDSDEIDVKAIVDLEAKDILEAEAAHTSLNDDGENADRQFRKQKCPHCPFSSNSGYEFRKHVNFHGTQDRYKCDHCSYSLDRLNLLSQHRKLHADEPGYNAFPPAANLLNTNFIFQQNAEMVDHEEVSDTGNLDEGKSDPSSRQFSCFYCPYKTTQKKLFDIHCNCHDLRKRYICDFCDWSADRMGLLYQHRKVHEHESTYNPSPEDKVFMNPEFDDGTSGEFEAKFMEIKHIDKPENEGDQGTPLSPPFKLTVVKKSYPCKMCPYKTNSKNNYSVHKSMHDSSAAFACTECSYASVNRGLLQQHLRLHTAAGISFSSLASSQVKSPINKQQPLDMESNFQQESVYLANSKIESQKTANRLESQSGSELKCQRCPFIASSQGVLKEHVRCHAAQDNVTCPFCDFSVSSKQAMFPHIQVHFPGTKLEPEAVEQMLEEHSRINNNNVHSSNDISKSLSPTNDKISAQLEKEVVTMKRVYVCHFCEREFEAKHLMIQHEKQHLGGSHSEDKCN